MDFHSLLRRDLQFLCKKNKIPANMTNVAMADALQALEIVEGLEEFLNQTEPTGPQSPTSVAKGLATTARTATRTTQRKPAAPLSVTRSSRATRTSVAEETDLENKNTNVPKTPAVQSTRRKAAATKKDESVQHAYSTRRSVRMLEKCMADMTLKPQDMDEDAQNNDAEKETASQEMDAAAGSVINEKSDDITGRDLSETLEKEWQVIEEDSEAQVDLGNASAKKMNELNTCPESDMKETEAIHAASPLTSKHILEAEAEKINSVQDIIPDAAADSINLDNKESLETGADTDIEEEDIIIDAAESEVEEGTESSESDISEAESESEEEEEDSVISEADSNQAVFGSDVAVHELEDSESEEKEKTPISAQFPRPTLSTTPAKSSGKKKLQTMAAEMGKENTDSYSGRKVEMVKEEEKKKKKKKKTIKGVVDEEALPNASLRQLIKMFKDLKGSRTPLQPLPDNHQVPATEQN